MSQPGRLRNCKADILATRVRPDSIEICAVQSRAKHTEMQLPLFLRGLGDAFPGHGAYAASIDATAKEIQSFKERCSCPCDDWSRFPQIASWLPPPLRAAE